MLVRDLVTHEWQLLKRLRLAALLSDPDAFGPTYASVADEPDAYWQLGAARMAKPWSRMFIGALDNESLGLISAVCDRERTGHLGAFWIDPRARGTGLGSALFDTAMRWLESQGCSLLELSVTEGNAQAEAMYARRGFVLSGRVEPLREGSSLRNLYMLKRVSGASRTDDAPH